MKLVDAKIEDGKMCAQLLNFLKVAKAPDNMSVQDCLALSATMAWFNEFVKALATELSAKKGEAPIVKPALILPVPKPKKLGKIKGKK